MPTTTQTTMTPGPATQTPTTTTHSTIETTFYICPTLNGKPLPPPSPATGAGFGNGCSAVCLMTEEGQPGAAQSTLSGLVTKVESRTVATDLVCRLSDYFNTANTTDSVGEIIDSLRETHIPAVLREQRERYKHVEGITWKDGMVKIGYSVDEIVRKAEDDKSEREAEESAKAEALMTEGRKGAPIEINSGLCDVGPEDALEDVGFLGASLGL